MKKLYFLLFLIFSAILAKANHITGGEMYYTLTSQSGNNYSYHIVLKLYRDCNSTGAPLDPSAPISIFSNADFSSVWAGNIAQTQFVTLNLGSPSPCINNPPTVCYQVGYYEFNVTLPGTLQGYTVAYQRCCRIAGINNLIGSNSVGATYTAQIPGTSALASAPANNSAHFIGADTVIVCANNPFCYNFGATDNDHDSLAYYFCTAYTGASTGNPAPNPPANPPYIPVPYASPYRETSPLGSGVNLDVNSGMMCGIAPPAGIYVVTVCVAEFRNGILIATQRKDLQIKVGDCNLVKAILPSSFPICDDFTRTFQNEAPANSLIHTYDWNFGDNTTSSAATPTHTFPDTGTYIIKLVINRGEQCGDSATSLAHVYPGFFPNFGFAGICLNRPTQFTDSTRTVYGFVNGWSWDFGDAATAADSSHLQNPAYTYNQTGIKNVRLIVTSNKGCIDTVFKDVVMLDKPPLKAQPKDTLICNGDQVVLNAIGSGNFTWSGPNIIANGNTPNPTVAPTVSSNYFVTLNDNGCINQDTARVRVVNFVTLQAQADTVICSTDSVRLHAATDGLHFDWTPAASLNDPHIQNPTALPVATTTYQVIATIGHCNATDDIKVTLVPYPVSNAGPDTTICYNASAQLHASIVGNAFTWTPVGSLSNPNILNPLASPKTTTRYILSVTDNIGCPKPKKDTVVVTVLPKVNAFAGKDTAVVIGQPLQFNAEGGVSYLWSPPTALNHVDIKNPIGIYDGSFDTIRYKVVVRDAAGCADSAYINVKIFKTNPQIFVPTAFTPNGDRRNDVVRPIAVGISRINYFRIYNRWGQLVFSTTINGMGWDGKIGGQEQGTATYVWVVQGVDFTGKVVFGKGTVTLIR